MSSPEMPRDVEEASDQGSWDLCAQEPTDTHIELQKRLDIANHGWPWGDVCPLRLVTQAPFMCNEYRGKVGFFTMAEAQQNAPLFNLYHGADYTILPILFRYHNMASKFAATCQTAFNLVLRFVHHWDISRAVFNGANKHPKRSGRDSTVGDVVIVSKFRNREFTGDHFECEMYSLHELTHALHNHAQRFEILHLHRIPMLTTQLLALVIPHMRKLKMLGVYRCELIHVGDTMRLLEIIRSDRGAGMTKTIALDFYPRYHFGPADGTPDTFSGSYGVTWDNEKLDTRLAIWQILYLALPQAKRQGVDLTSKDAAFRLWLERVPLWRLDDTIHAILHERDPFILAAQIDFPHTRGSIRKLACDQFWAARSFECRVCKARLLGIFFEYEEFRIYEYHSRHVAMECLGCTLTNILNNEEDHYKVVKQRMVRAWLGDNTDDLQQALSLDSTKRGRKVAARYDKARIKREAMGEQWVQRPRDIRIRSSPVITDIEPSDEQW